MSLEEFLAAGDAIPPGVTARSHTSMLLPPQIPDLIGVKDRRFLDHTGLVLHRDIGDLMRYSALVQDAIGLARYGETQPEPSTGRATRYTDEQLYALALYLYSLTPPKNPNQFGAEAAKGERIFEREGCAGCHTPPHYTNNKLIPVDGFEPTSRSSRAVRHPLDTDRHRSAIRTADPQGYRILQSSIAQRGLVSGTFRASRLCSDSRGLVRPGSIIERLPSHRLCGSRWSRARRQRTRVRT